jgi:hypothetical protein
MLGKLFSTELLSDLASLHPVRVAELHVGPADFRMAVLALIAALLVHAIAFAAGLDRVEPAARPAWTRRLVRAHLSSRAPVLRGAFVALAFAVTLVLGYVNSAQFVYFQF